MNVYSQRLSRPEAHMISLIFGLVAQILNAVVSLVLGILHVAL